MAREAAIGVGDDLAPGQPGIGRCSAVMARAGAGVGMICARADLRRLSRDPLDDLHRIGAEAPGGVPVADVAQHLARDLRRVDPGIRRDLAHQADQVALDRAFDRDAGAGIPGKASVEDGVRDLIRDLVGMTGGRGLGRERPVGDEHGSTCFFRAFGEMPRRTALPAGNPSPWRSGIGDRCNAGRRSAQDRSNRGGGSARQLRALIVKTVSVRCRDHARRLGRRIRLRGGAGSRCRLCVDRRGRYLGASRDRMKKSVISRFEKQPCAALVLILTPINEAGRGLVFVKCVWTLNFFDATFRLEKFDLGGRVVGWRLYSCRQGAVAVRSDYDLYRAVEGKSDWAVRPDQGLRLLPPRGVDDFLRHHLRLPFDLTEEELACLSFDGPEAVCATCYGPESQDKSTNQDFCLSGVISTPDGVRLSFGILCDGVSTRSFWSQRGAQIAAFGAFRALRNFWLGTAHRGRSLNDSDARDFKRMMVDAVRDLIRSDRDNLLYSVQGVPEDFASQVFERNKDRREAWHNSTMIVTALSELGGLVAFAGDGGIYLHKTRRGNEDEPVKCILQSSDEMGIDSYVSPDFAEKDVRVGVISVEGCVAAEIVACTDGVDRTLRRAARTPFDDAGGLMSSAAVDAFLDALPDSFPDTLEIDNYTMARVAWPVLVDRGPAHASRNDANGSAPMQASRIDPVHSDFGGAPAEGISATDLNVFSEPHVAPPAALETSPDERPSSDGSHDRRDG